MTAMLLCEFDMITLVPFAFFGVVAVGIWLVMDLMSKRKTRSEERLEELRDPGRRKNDDGIQKGPGDAMTRVLKKATPALARPLTPKDEKAASKIKSRLSYAGFRHEAAPTMFLGLKFAGLISGLVISGGWAFIAKDFNISGMMNKDVIFKIILFTGGMFYLPDLLVGYMAMKRKENIFLAMPDALDLLVVCVESGLGLDQAMRKVSDEMKKSHKIIAEEFRLCNMQLQMGRSRNEVLHELGERNGVDDLRALAAIIIQSDKFGSSIAQALRVQSDSMRTKRAQLAEEKAAKTAVKLLFPLVLFIFPGIFVVLVGPAAIQMINKFLPTLAQ